MEMDLRELLNGYLKEREIRKNEFATSLGLSINKFYEFTNGYIGNYKELIVALENNEELYADVVRYYRSLKEPCKKPYIRKQTLQERNPRVFY